MDFGGFAGRLPRGILPTDVDGLIDFGDRLFIHLEFKHRDKDMDRGQRVALERSARAHYAGDRPSYVIVARHNLPWNSAIPAASCRAIKVYDGKGEGKWSDVTGTVLDNVKSICDRHGIKLPHIDSPEPAPSELSAEDAAWQRRTGNALAKIQDILD